MRIAVIMSGFPRRSETFALNELIALEDRGVLAAIFATKPGDGSSHPGVDRVVHRLRVLEPGAPEDQAAQVAEALGGLPITGLHGYFAHDPAQVARLAAARLGCAWGFSTHARDARKVDAAELAARAREAACVVACNHDVAAELTAVGATVTLIPHGVDLTRFQSGESTPNGRMRLLSVGRLVEKKGFPVVIDAVAAMQSEAELRIVGDGPLRGALERQVQVAGVSGRITLPGPMTHGDLPAAYASADVVVVPSVVDASGDRDGLPNVVLEALASGAAVVASDVGAVSAAIDDGVTGLLVPPGDVTALAGALDRLAADADLRRDLARSGRARVERDYHLDRCTDRLIELLERVYA